MEWNGAVTAATFSYRAVRKDGSGSVERGTLSAESGAAVLAALDRRGFLPLEVKQTSTERERRPTISAADLALGLRMLADILDAGIPVNRALQAIRELVPAAWKPLLDYVEPAVREGQTLGAALRDAPVEVPALVVGMTLAGEHAGAVGAAIRRAAEVSEAAAETRAAIRAALAYPLVLAAAGSGAIAIMVGVVIPRFAAILSDVGQTLPKSTILVLNSAVAARTASIPAIGIALVAGVALRIWTSTASGRRSWHELLLTIPLLGTVRAAAATSRACFTLASLLDTGVPLRQAMKLAASASGDAAIAARLAESTGRIEAGLSIAAALRDRHALTPLALRLARAGEESGRLASLLRHASKLEQRRADEIMRAAVRLLEPTLILIFAGIVAVVAAALLQAVYSVRPVS